MVDMVVPRPELRATLIRLLGLLRGGELPAPLPLEMGEETGEDGADTRA